jgi:hypothetical protein
MKLTKILTETYDYYQAEDGAEYRVVVRSGHTPMRLEVLASGEWVPVSDTDTKDALMDAWVRS